MIYILIKNLIALQSLFSKKKWNYKNYLSQQGIFSEKSIINHFSILTIILIIETVITALGIVFYYCSSYFFNLNSTQLSAILIVTVVVGIFFIINLFTNLVYFFYKKKYYKLVNAYQTHFDQQFFFERQAQIIKRCENMTFTNLYPECYFSVNSTYKYLRQRFKSATDSYIEYFNQIYSEYKELDSLLISMKRVPSKYVILKFLKNKSIKPAQIDQLTVNRNEINNIITDTEKALHYLRMELETLNKYGDKLKTIEDFKNTFENEMKSLISVKSLRSLYRNYCQGLLDLEDVYQKEKDTIFKKVSKYGFADIHRNLDYKNYTNYVITADFFAPFSSFNVLSNVKKIGRQIGSNIMYFKYAVDRLNSSKDLAIEQIGVIDTIKTNLFISQLKDGVFKDMLLQFQNAVEIYNQGCEQLKNEMETIYQMLLKQIYDESLSDDIDLESYLVTQIFENSERITLRMSVTKCENALRQLTENNPIYHYQYAVFSDDYESVIAYKEKGYDDTGSDEFGNNIVHYCAMYGAKHCYRLYKLSPLNYHLNNDGLFPIDIATPSICHQITIATCYADRFQYTDSLNQFLEDADEINIYEMLKNLMNYETKIANRHHNVLFIEKLQKKHSKNISGIFKNSNDFMVIEKIYNMALDDLEVKSEQLFLKLQTVSEYRTYFIKELDISRFVLEIRSKVKNALIKFNAGELASIEKVVNQVLALTSSNHVLNKYYEDLNYRDIGLLLLPNYYERYNLKIYEANRLIKSPYLSKIIRERIARALRRWLIILEQDYLRQPQMASWQILKQYNRKFCEKYGEMDYYYRLLGLKSTATEAEIKKAYRRKILEKHVDRGGNIEESTLINEAYRCLMLER